MANRCSFNFKSRDSANDTKPVMNAICDLMYEFEVGGKNTFHFVCFVLSFSST